MKIRLLDTNIILRHLTSDVPKQSKAATEYLLKIEQGKIRVRITDTIVFEAVFTLERFYKQSKAKIREILLPLIELSGVFLPGKRRMRKIFDLYVQLNLPFADAYHAVIMKQLKIDEIVSYDEDFDRIPGITRIKPE